MKKNILLTALILTILSQPAFSKELFASPEELETLQERFYETPTSALPNVEVEEEEEQPYEHKAPGMPLFKKARIKVTNYLRERDYKNTQKLIEKEKRESEKFEVPVNNTQPSKEEIQEPENVMELEGGIKENISSNDIMLDADNINYDEKTLDIVATGSPVLEFPPQQITVKADKMIYNQASNILKAFGSVEVIRNGTSIFGDYMQINMNEENAFIDDIKTKESIMTVRARKAEMQEDKIILHDGKFSSEDSYILNLQTKMIGGNHFNNLMLDDDEKSSLTDATGEVAVNVKAKEIFVNAKRDHDVLTLKKAQINYGDTKLWTIPSITIHTNKTHSFFDGNYPELGSRGRIGMFAGPGFVFDTPLQNGSTIKLIPMVNNKSGFGIGALAKYRSATNYTDFGYGSAADIFILKGRQHLDDKLYLQYGINSFMDEWWLGPRMSKYNAELIFKDETIIKSTIAKDHNLKFKQRFGIGYMQNGGLNRHGEHLPESNLGTLRTRYMAEASQNLLHYIDKQAKRKVDLDLVLQGSAAIYGTGDTQMIGRIGPRLHTQYKYWLQDIGYFASAYQDGTPMRMYDCYRYGHSNIYVRESLRINKYLTLAWSGSMTMAGDAPNGKTFQENSFIVAIGPDDLKLNFGYDWIRQQTYFSCLIAMDTKGSSIEFEKMEIKNADRLAKNKEEKVELKVFGEEAIDKTPKKMMYAEVIDIEDPDKEAI